MAEKVGFDSLSTCSKCGKEIVLDSISMCAQCYVELAMQEYYLSKYEGKPLIVPPSCPFPFAHAAYNRSLSEVSVDSSKLKTNRCQSCNKKVGLMGFSCRCGKVFCALHRYPMEHSCSFDFKAADRLILAKQNPVIKPDKLQSRV